MTWPFQSLRDEAFYEVQGFELAHLMGLISVQVAHSRSKSKPLFTAPVYCQLGEHLSARRRMISACGPCNVSSHRRRRMKRIVQASS